MAEQTLDILNNKEKEIKRRLFSIASLESHDNYFYELFKNEIDFTDEEKNACEGFYHLAGRGLFGKLLVDDNLANTCIKWILTGENKYYEIIKEWFLWHLKENIIKKQKEQARYKEEEKIENKQEQSGFIYVIKSKNLYKIGRALDSVSRIKTYKTENPFGIKVILQKFTDDYIEKEKEFLKKFQAKQVRGEWFKLGKEDINWIKQNL